MSFKEGCKKIKKLLTFSKDIIKYTLCDEIKYDRNLRNTEGETIVVTRDSAGESRTRSQYDTKTQKRGTQTEERGVRKPNFKSQGQGRPDRNSNNAGKFRKDSGSGYNKDKDLDNEGRAKHRQSSSKDSGKVKELQTDKFETIKRLEREQKTIKKKEESKKKTEKQRPQQKVKRANNVNYTKAYENGMYDDYEDMY